MGFGSHEWDMLQPSHVFRIGVVLFPQFELLDVYGPLEMFGALENASITLIAENPGIIASAQGPGGVATAGWSEDHPYDLLLVPGGIGTRSAVNQPEFLDALKSLADRTPLVASVCTGSALLAKAGVLDGHRATSNKAAFDWVTTQSSRVTWVRTARWVQDGNRFTSSGVSAGMDMALGIIECVFGLDTSLRIARYAEYLWNQDPDHDPYSAEPDVKISH